jgi:hypothetical protein
VRDRVVDYLGGALNDRAYAIAVNAAGEACITGETASTGAGAAAFPTANAIQGTNAGGTNDVFVAKLNAAGNALLYSTYLGADGHCHSTVVLQTRLLTLAQQ